MHRWIKWALAISLTPAFLLAERKAQPDFIAIGWGAYDFHRTAYRTQQWSFEYRWNYRPYVASPLVGVMATEKQSVYYYGGVWFQIPLGDRFALLPSFAPGLYIKGQGKDLGYTLEFRSALEFAVILGKQFRVGVQLYHLSNASLGHKNPGEESLIVQLSIPFWRDPRGKPR